MAMQEKLKEIAQRIYALRDIFGYSIEEMAAATELSCEEYDAYERGDRDFSFTFLYNVARKLGVDMTELFTGETPHLSSYCVVRKGDGLPMERNRALSTIISPTRKGPDWRSLSGDRQIFQRGRRGSLHLNYHEGRSSTIF